MKNIDEILNKYFEGESSLEEEKALREYFQQGTIDEQHKEYTSMFQFFSHEREEKVTQLPQKKKKKRPAYIWISIAAGFLLLLTVKSVYTTIENRSKTLVYIDGKKVTNQQTINSEVLNSLENVSEMDEDIVDSQIGILDSFTD